VKVSNAEQHQDVLTTTEHSLNELIWRRLGTITVITVRQYGYEFQASSLMVRDPFGARMRTKLGTLLRAT